MFFSLRGKVTIQVRLEENFVQTDSQVRMWERKEKKPPTETGYCLYSQNQQEPVEPVFERYLVKCIWLESNTKLHWCETTEQNRDTFHTDKRTVAVWTGLGRIGSYRWTCGRCSPGKCSEGPRDPAVLPPSCSARQSCRSQHSSCDGDAAAAARARAPLQV